MSAKVGVMYLGQMVELGPIETVYSNPLHPYTRRYCPARCRSIPENGTRAPLFSGKSPGALNPPTGCRFHPRCPLAMEQCSVVEPVMQEVQGRTVACHLYS